MIGLILMLVFLLVVVILVIYALKRVPKVIKNTEEQNKMSFREAMDLVGLPVVTFCNRDTKLNFLLDTGSDLSYINKSILSFLEYTKIQGIKKNIISAGGSNQASECCKMTVTYRDQEFIDKFYICELDEPFAQIKGETGVQIHGILGSGFFERYKYILDFKSLVAYSKK